MSLYFKTAYLRLCAISAILYYDVDFLSREKHEAKNVNVSSGRLRSCAICKNVSVSSGWLRSCAICKNVSVSSGWLRSCAICVLVCLGI